VDKHYNIRWVGTDTQLTDRHSAKACVDDSHCTQYLPMRPTVTAPRLRKMCHHFAITSLANFARYSFNNTAAQAKPTSTLRNEIANTPPKSSMALGFLGSKMARKSDMEISTKVVMAAWAAPRVFVAARKLGITWSQARRFSRPDTPNERANTIVMC
jgi:hypothetical protein